MLDDLDPALGGTFQTRTPASSLLSASTKPARAERAEQGCVGGWDAVGQGAARAAVAKARRRAQMILEGWIGLHKAVVLRLKVPQRDRAVAALGEKHHGRSGRIEKQRDAPSAGILQIGKVARDRDRRGGVDDDIGLSQFLHQLRVGLGDVADHGGEGFIEEQAHLPRQRQSLRSAEFIGQQGVTRQIVRKQVSRYRQRSRKTRPRAPCSSRFAIPALRAPTRTTRRRSGAACPATAAASSRSNAR